MSALIYLNPRTVLIIGLLLVAGHNLLDGIQGTSAFWSFLHEPREFLLGDRAIVVRYPVLPWIGIMAVGYYFGTLYDAVFEAEYRKTILATVGLICIAMFICLRSINVYGDPVQWSYFPTNTQTILSYLAVTKYPPSLLYTLITIGPALLFLAYSEKRLNALTYKVSVIGRVPMFYYILHIYLIHLFAIIGAEAYGLNWSDMISNNRINKVVALKGHGFGLGTVYMVWFVTVLTLYPLCKGFDRYKRKYHGYWWLSHI